MKIHFVYTEFGIWGSLIFFFLVKLLSFWDLSSLTRVEPGPPSSDARSPNHKTAQDFPGAPRFSVSTVDMASNLGEIFMWVSLYWCSETSESIDNSTVWKTKKLFSTNWYIYHIYWYIYIQPIDIYIYISLYIYFLVSQIETTISFSHETLKYLPETGLQWTKKKKKEKPTYVYICLCVIRVYICIKSVMFVIHQSVHWKVVQ